MTARVGRARACANIALAKYWGKCDVALNLPAVPSISLTLDGLVTETEVRFVPGRRGDRLILDGKEASPKESKRATRMLDEIRARAKLRDGAEIVSVNRFPTAAGLASSASGFAALAAAASRAAGLRLSEKEQSRMARRASASAARSIYGGFAELPAGKPGDDRLAAKPIAPASHWDVRIVVALATKERKSVGSTEGMERSRRTSPFYDAWVEAAPKLAAVVRRAIRARELDRLGRAMEQSTLAFHACAIASDPGIVYWRPTTLAILDVVRGLRDAGVSAWATMDAGPHVKVLCAANDAPRVRRAVARVPGVVGTIVCKPGPGVR